jgi:hypothetical protein
MPPWRRDKDPALNLLSPLKQAADGRVSHWFLAYKRPNL